MKTKEILIKGAKLHNLKNITVGIPRNKLVVITGLSGSGKSSLAFDTLYAEGQRRYVESLSSYARQFLGKLDKPKVDNIVGIAPAIAIQQKVNTSNPRSTVGTSTEVYDYLKLLFARIGKTYSPISGQEVKKHTVTDVVDAVMRYPEGTKLLLLAPVSIPKDRTVEQVLKLLLQQGYVRILHKEEIIRLEEDNLPKNLDNFQLVVDRVIVRHDEDFQHRLADAVDTAFFEGKGECYIQEMDGVVQTHFSNRFELDGITFLEPNVHLFSFNNPYGACPKCDGYGDTIGLDEDLIVPNTGLSVYENAIYPWRGETMSWFRDQLVNNAYKFDFPIHKPWFELTDEHKKQVGEADLLMLNAQDHTYAKVALTNDEGLQAAIAGVSTLESTLSRGLIWGALWENVRDARLPVSTFVDAVVRNVSLEPSASLLGSMVSHAQAAVANYASQTERENLYNALHDAFSTALAAASPGSDAQLILLRALITVSGVATQGEETCRDIARGAFEDTTGDIAVATGIPYDQNLGWAALGALAERNLVSVAELEQAAGYNPSSISANGYAYALAALPQAEHKAEAYRTVMEDSTLSNDALSSTANGFRLGPDELREPYFESYFAALSDIWESRSIGMATRIVRGLYPRISYGHGSAAGLDVDNTAPVALAERWLQEHPEAPSALRRLILEAQDLTRRNLNAQKFNATH